MPGPPHHCQCFDGDDNVGVSRSPKSATVRYDRESLIDVALEVFRTRGYDATSMEHLAAAAGISKASIYHHVSGKEELLDAGLQRALNALEATLDEPVAAGGPAVDRLRYVLRRVVELEGDLLAEVTVLLRARGNSTIETAAVKRRRTFDQAVAELIAEGQRDGSIRSDIEPGLASRLAIGMATWLVEWYRPGGKLTNSQLADAVVTMVCDGLVVDTH
jgi:AcrR family transcriptional regulator